MQPYVRSEWSDEEVGRLVQLVVDGKHTYAEIAEMFGRSAESCRHKARDLNLRHPKGTRPWSSDLARNAAALGWTEFSRLYPNASPVQYQEARVAYREKVDAPGFVVPDYSRQIERVEGDVAIAACVHVPETDPVMWARLLAIGERDKLPGLIIAGDAVTADMFSHWPADGVSVSWEFDTELESLRRHLKTALEVFEFVYILPGNHVGNRIVRVSGGHIKLHNLLAMAGLKDAERDRIVTTNLDYLSLDSGDQSFLVGHATNYSSRGGNIAVDYSEKYMTNTIVGNGHLSGMGITKSGAYAGYEIGTMASPSAMGYAMRGLTKFPKMQQSFVTVINGTVKMYGSCKPMTDWEAELSKNTEG